MYHFQYVPKKQWTPLRKEIIELLHDIQNDLRKKFTFQYQLIGGASRNMVTIDPTTNIGFDFDFNIIINNPELFPPKQFKEMLISRINKHSSKYGYDPAEDSTRAITIKVKDKKMQKSNIALILQSFTITLTRKATTVRSISTMTNPLANIYGKNSHPATMSFQIKSLSARKTVFGTIK